MDGAVEVRTVSVDKVSPKERDNLILSLFIKDIGLNAHENIPADKNTMGHSPAKTIAHPQIHMSRGDTRDSPCISPLLAESHPTLCPNI